MNIRTIDTEGDIHPAQEGCLFSFDGPYGALRGIGAAQPIPRGRGDTLESRLAGLAGMIGGALPFSEQDEDCLWRADSVLTSQALPVASQMAAALLPKVHSMQPEPPVGDFARAVAQALRIMGDSAGQDQALTKVVLSRTLALTTDRPIPADLVMARLAQDRTVTTFATRLPDQPGQDGPRLLIGATPELLLRKSGAQIVSHPLAGSAPRSADPVRDRAAANGLLQSDKDRREHALVVEYILDVLAPFCADLGCPEGTTLTHTGSMWHLGTRIQGRLRDESLPSILLASRLHPTPAICGLPVRRAADLIHQLEPVPRGFYAGATGWNDAQGDGAWFVTIRCAEICGTTARLHAGAGIVPGSDPMAEAAETGAKFGALLDALGLPRAAGMTGIHSAS